MRLLFASIAAAGLSLATAAPANAVTTVLTFAGDICGVSGTDGCGNGTRIGQNYGDSAIQDVSYRSYFATTGVTYEDYLKHWGAGYGDLPDVVWGGANETSYGAEIIITPAAGYEVSLSSLLGGCYQARGSCLRFPVTITSASGAGIASAVLSPPAGGHDTLTVNSAYFRDGIVLRWGPDAYDGGLNNITFDVRAVTGAGAVPEPATWAMMIAGFGLVGGAMRRRGAAPALA